MDKPTAVKRDVPIPGRAVPDPTEGAFPADAGPPKKGERGKKSKVAALPPKGKPKQSPIDAKRLASMKKSLDFK